MRPNLDVWARLDGSDALPIMPLPVSFALMGVGGPSSPTFAAAGSLCLEGTGSPTVSLSFCVWRFLFLLDPTMLANRLGGGVVLSLVGSF